jgi:hypothetical protein
LANREVQFGTKGGGGHKTQVISSRFGPKIDQNYVYVSNWAVCNQQKVQRRSRKRSPQNRRVAQNIF